MLGATISTAVGASLVAMLMVESATKYQFGVAIANSQESPIFE